MKHRGWEKLPGPFSRETTRLQFTMIRFNEEETRSAWNTRRRIDGNVARIRIKADLFSLRIQASSP